MLEVRDLRVRYGPIEAVKGIDLRVEAGEVVALIGANGAGKTTALKAIAGLLPCAGEVRYQGAPLGRLAAERRAARGLVLVPEGRGILGQMTVRENLLMGAYPRRDRAAIASDLAAVLQRFPVLGERLEAPATLLSGGEQQMLALGRALLAKPRLLMLDEPSLGLAPLMVRQVFAIVDELRRSGLTILLVEQKARQTLAVADRAYVLETGRVVAEGPAGELARGSVVAEAFLGAARAN
jgi:branched-chain amino acid transport system ATP-binding protein